MEFFNRIKEFFQNINKKEKQKCLPVENESCVTRNKAAKGSIDIEYYNRNRNRIQFYDTTRLKVDFNDYEIIDETKVYNCQLTWKNRNRESNDDYIMVKTNIDEKLIKTDDKYFEIMSQKLLEKNKVEQYLRYSLQENSRIESGNYIGQIINSEERGYVERFNSAIGRNVHNCDEMKQRRKEVNEELKKEKEYREKRLEESNNRCELQKGEI